MIITPDMLVDRIYPDQNVHAQATGRWSTIKPPLAQFPPKLRNTIMAAPGTYLLEFDLDQEELRIQAALAHDKPLLEAFAKGYEVHTLNCCEVFDIPYPPDLFNPHKSEEAKEWRERFNWTGKDDQRRVFGKRFVYRLMYRGDPRFAYDIPGAKNLGLTSEKLVRASNNWLANHPAIKVYWNKCDEEIRRTRRTRSANGRVRILHALGPEAFREGTNHRIQGTASDNFNILFIKIKEALPKALWILGRHDSQTWQVPIDEKEEYRRVMKGIIYTPWSIEGTEMVIPATFKDEE